GQCRLVELGFRQGGSAGFGLRRLLVDQYGNKKAELLRGERKSLQTDRVILIPGPADEQDTVHGIYSRFVQGQSEQQIANALNSQGLRNAFDRPWRSSSVREVLTNEKYIGANVYNRKSFKLKKNHVTNPPEMWIRKEDAFESVVAVELYAQAQLRIQQQSKRLTDEEILKELRRVQERRGRLSGIVIDEDGTLTSTLVQSRFGGLHRAYSLIGYTPERDFSYMEINRNIRLLHPGIMEEACRKLTSRGGSAQPGERPDLVSVNGEFGSKRWVVRLNPSRADINLAVRLDEDNKNMLDFYLIPRIALEGERLTLRDFNHANVESFRFDSLDGLSNLAARTEMRMAS
ncbi:MAG: recombinase family protein, partial [Verrucomicrobiaceae bacterium]